MNRFTPIPLVVLWSSGFVGATLASRSAPAETTLLWRYVVAVVPLVGWALWTRRRYGARFLVREGVIGILAQGGYCLGVYRAADMGVLPGTSALVASLQPPLVAAVLWAGSGGRTDRRQALGLVTGMAGVLLVVGGDLGGAGGTAGLTAVGLGTLSLTAATLVAGRWAEPPGHGVMDSLAVQSVMALGSFAAVALATGTAAPPRDGDFWLAIAWLVVLPAFGGYGTYYYVLRTSGPVAVSAWLYLTPAVAALWAWPMFGEPLTVRAAVGFLIAAAGVAAVVRAKRPVSHSSTRGPQRRGDPAGCAAAGATAGTRSRSGRETRPDERARRRPDPAGPARRW
ncbi:MAG: DMT family transporter [Nocardioides sp.]|uniref:DMT family transporter n=1 Tax=Nocardioides sp. TaxID=35761 RepID=UPI003266AD7A